MQEIGNKHAKQTRYAIPTFQAIRGPNYTMMEYSLLSRCNHKAGLDGLMAYCLTWHIGLDSRSQIIP